MYDEFNFTRDWNKIAQFKSGIGETVDLFPIIFSVPGKKIELTGLQLDAEVKPQISGTIVYRNSSSVINLNNKDFIKRTVFIDKVDVSRMISYIERDIIPNLKTTFKKKSKEYVFKSNELFFSFLINEKTARITMHIVDFGPLGDGFGGGEQIEFWTESKIDDEILSALRKPIGLIPVTVAFYLCTLILPIEGLVGDIATNIVKAFVIFTIFSALSNAVKPIFVALSTSAWLTASMQMWLERASRFLVWVIGIAIILDIFK